MKKIVWVPLVIVAVVLSIALGMKLGGGSKPPMPVAQGTNNGGPTGPATPANGGRTADGSGGGSTANRDRKPQPIVMFTVSPDEPESGAPVTLSDDTEIGDDNTILVSEWKIEGPGLTIPAQLSGEEAEFTFPEEGFYRVAHRLQLKEGGLTDWVTQVVAVKQGESKPDETAPRLETRVITDASGAIELWVEDNQVRFRVNSKALDEDEKGLIQDMRAKVTFATGESSSIGPGSFRMDTTLGIGLQHSALSTFSITGKLPSGRVWEQEFTIR